MKRIFIDGLSGMAQGLFATLIIGTIIQQLGMFVGGNYGVRNFKKYSKYSKSIFRFIISTYNYMW